jgi:serine/threonine-protein kinase
MHPEALTLFRRLADRSPSDREAYYAEHQVDPAVRAEVESLLPFDRRTADSLHDCVAGEAAEVLYHRYQPPAGLTEPQALAASAAVSISAPLTGRCVGVFEVQGLLGAGGMGEVYRARDTRLGREVAIKILPRAFREDREHIARFEHEARVLASLNHPHIGVVYGLEEVDGYDALVMEFVDGEDLAERIKHHPLPLDEALDTARQVAEALEAAHAQGIVHRDLKPANIRRRRDGMIKVLDFGLAKHVAPVADAPSATQTGVIRGTPAYMSPEQARGDPIDSRADIWSFGVVIFEMLTGVKPFARDTTAETLVSVLTSAPDYQLLPVETPPRIRSLIRRCTERDRRRRLQHVGDARIELEDALGQAADDAASSTGDGGRRLATRAWNTRRVAAVTLLAAALGAVVGAFWLAPRPAPSPVVRTIIPGATFVSGTDQNFALTPDGSRLGYVSSDARQIFVRPLDALEPIPILTTAAYLRGLFPSPDGQWFAYVENNFTLRKIAAAGGPPTTIVAMDGPSRGATWGTGNTIVFATGLYDTGLQRISADGGPVTVLTRPDPGRGERDHVQPAGLPDHRKLLFTITPQRGGVDGSKIAVLDLESGTWRTVLEGGFGARYVEGGYLVYAAAGALWATRFDLTRQETRGPRVEILKPVSTILPGTTAEFDVAANGTLAYTRGSVSDVEFVPVWVDRSGRETPIPAPPDKYRHPRFSPDGKRVAIATDDIYLWDPTRDWSDATRMTFASATDWYPVWTPDARQIVFGSWRGGRFSNLYILDTNTGSTARLTNSPDMQLPTAISRDGTTVVFHSFTKSLQAVQMRAGAEPVTLVETPGEERNGDLSPDGRWLAYEGESATHAGQIDVYVRSFPDVERGLWQVSRDGGTFPRWARNGRELFFIAPSGAMMAVSVNVSGSTWKAGSPVKLFEGRYATREGSLGRLYDVAPDGRFLMFKNLTGVHAAHFIIVQNWPSELARQLR